MSVFVNRLTAFAYGFNSRGLLSRDVLVDLGQRCVRVSRPLIYRDRFPAESERKRWQLPFGGDVA